MDQLFDIQKFKIEDAAKLDATPNDPHQHEWEELLVGLEGELDHFIDFKSSLFSAPLISFITKGKIHRAKPKAKEGNLDIWLIRDCLFKGGGRHHTFCQFDKMIQPMGSNEVCMCQCMLMMR